MSKLHQFTTQVIPIVDRDKPLSFHEFVELSTDEAHLAFSELENDEDDVAPFVMTATGGRLSLLGWDSLDDELQEKFLTHVLPPAVASQDADMVALVITTHLTPMDEGRQLRDEERYEAVVIAALGSDGLERTLQARIDRVDDRPPALGQAELIAESLPPAFVESLNEALFGRFER